jgi:transposase-like protein
MQTSSRTRKRWTADQRDQIVRAYRDSQLTQKEFAAQAGVGPSTLYSWLRKARPARQGRSSAFIAVPNLLTVAPAYRLQWPGGLTLEVRSGFQPGELADLLQLLPPP